jgi:hypothetical protein
MEAEITDVEAILLEAELAPRWILPHREETDGFDHQLED